MHGESLLIEGNIKARNQSSTLDKYLARDPRELMLQYDITSDDLPGLYTAQLFYTCREFAYLRCSNDSKPKYNAAVPVGASSVVFQTKIRSSTWLPEYTAALKRAGLDDVSDILKRLKAAGLDLTEEKKINRFRNTALQIRDKGKKLKVSAMKREINEECFTLDAAKSVFKKHVSRLMTAADFEHLMQLIEQDAAIDEHVLQSLAQLLHTLDNGYLKLRPQNSLKNKAANAICVLKAMPEVLDLPAIFGADPVLGPMWSQASAEISGTLPAMLAVLRQSVGRTSSEEELAAEMKTLHV